jgi:uncharacterized protein (DUF2235 family)
MANIVICADGTWNRPEEDLEKDFPTNVLKLARAIKPSANGVKQHVFYDWGLGVDLKFLLLASELDILTESHFQQSFILKNA